jgi:hypothetical protein
MRNFGDERERIGNHARLDHWFSVSVNNCSDINELVINDSLPLQLLEKHRDVGANLVGIRVAELFLQL